MRTDRRASIQPTTAARSVPLMQTPVPHKTPAVPLLKLGGLGGDFATPRGNLESTSSRRGSASHRSVPAVSARLAAPAQVMRALLPIFHPCVAYSVATCTYHHILNLALWALGLEPNQLETWAKSARQPTLGKLTMNRTRFWVEESGLRRTEQSF